MRHRIPLFVLSVSLGAPACGGSTTDDGTDGQGGAAGAGGGAGSSAAAGKGGGLGSSGSGGSAAGSQGGSSGGGASGGGGCGTTLTGRVRDFRKTQADFEYKLGDDKGIVKIDLGVDGKPVYASATNTPTTHGKADFDQWYRDVPGVNLGIPISLTLMKGTGGVYTYSNQAFFPIDGMGFGNEGNPHNFHFTFELHTKFRYDGGETFRFTGDDDLFTFVNGKLAIDLGGVHGAEDGLIDLDAKAKALGLVKGQIYALDFFFAERHTSESTFRIDTSLGFVDCGVGDPKLAAGTGRGWFVRSSFPAALIASVAFVGGCTPRSSERAAQAQAPPPPPTAIAPAVVASDSLPDGSAVGEDADADAGAVVVVVVAEPDKQPLRVSLEDATVALFPERASRLDAVAACKGARGHHDAVQCLLRRAYGADERSAKIVLDLHTRAGTIVGIEREYDMDGGYRGTVHLVPELPVGKYRRHLEYIDGASRDGDAFLAALVAASTVGVRYRARPLIYRVFRSVGRTTPAAYAQGWTIAYNVSGSLNTSADAVRETLFHEVFHLNDSDHGDWSPRALGATYDRIVQRCGTKTSCLRPYAPNDTTVRGGTYYAFQPGNDVREYAAELAVRYYREHRARLGVGPGRSPGSPFKCGPPENATAWAALRDEFFGGVDRTDPCR